MILKIAIPGKMKLKITRREPFPIHRKGDLHYIVGAEVLPPPLQSDQENQVIGDLGTEYEDEAKAILIEHNLRLVVYIAKKFDNTGVGVEDLISIGTIGLIKSINTFNPEKNIKLATYASRCIENEILMYLRRNNKTKMEVSIDEPLNVDWDGNELLLSDILGTDDRKRSGAQAFNECRKQAVEPGEDHCAAEVRTGDPGRTGDDTEGSGKLSWNLPVLYFETGKKDHEAAEKGDQPAYLTLHSGRIHDTIKITERTHSPDCE